MIRAFTLRNLRAPALAVLAVLAALFCVLDQPDPAQAQQHGEAHIRSLDPHPTVRSPRMNEAWRIYEDYRATQQRIAIIQYRIADLTGQVHDIYAPGFIMGHQAAASAGLGRDLASLNADLQREQRHAADLVAQWGANDLVFGDVYLGPLENATISITVHYGPNMEYVAQMDPINIGLIRWDQAVTAEQATQQTRPTFSSLNGVWQIANRQRQLSVLTISGGGGTIDYYGNGINPVSGMSFDQGSGRVSFTETDVNWNRGATTRYVGTLTVREDGRVFIVEGTMSRPDGDYPFFAELVEAR